MKLGGILLLPLELESQSGWKFENKEIETRLEEEFSEKSVPQTIYLVSRAQWFSSGISETSFFICFVYGTKRTTKQKMINNCERTIHKKLMHWRIRFLSGFLG